MTNNQRHDVATDIRTGDLIQDTLGHWYKVVEVQANGFRLKVDQLYRVYSLGGTPLRSYGRPPIVMGRSAFKGAR
jgi:hypothetical protein